MAALWGSCRCAELFDEEQQGDGGDGQPADDAEAVHEGEEGGLMLELLVDDAVGCGE